MIGITIIIIIINIIISAHQPGISNPWSYHYLSRSEATYSHSSTTNRFLLLQPSILSSLPPALLWLATFCPFREFPSTNVSLLIPVGTFILSPRLVSSPIISCSGINKINRSTSSSLFEHTRSYYRPFTSTSIYRIDSQPDKQAMQTRVQRRRMTPELTAFVGNCWWQKQIKKQWPSLQSTAQHRQINTVHSSWTLSRAA